MGYSQIFFPDVILQKQEAANSTANKDYCQFDSQVRFFNASAPAS